MQSPASTAESLITYPCRFPIKVMGVNTPDFMAAVIDIATACEPGFDAESLSPRPSREGRYLGLTVAVLVESRAQLDGLYRSLTAHPLVKYVL